MYNALGRTAEGRYLSVFFIRKLGNKALIITSRGMNNRERTRYEKNKQQEMTMLEASDYFDEHDIFEFDDAKEVAEIKFKLQNMKAYHRT